MYPSKKVTKAAEASKNLAAKKAPKVTSKDNDKTVKSVGDQKRKLEDESQATSKGEGTTKKVVVNNNFFELGPVKKIKK